MLVVILILPCGTERLVCGLFLFSWYPVASVWLFVYLVSESKVSRRNTGMPDASGHNLRGVVDSNFGGSGSSIIHTPCLNWLAFLLGSNLGLSEGAVGNEKLSQKLQFGCVGSAVFIDSNE